MGDTSPPREEGGCLGRSVTWWTTSSVYCSPARRRKNGWLCADFGISRKTGYKIYHRYKGLGMRADGPQPTGTATRESITDGDRDADRPAEEGLSHLGRPMIRERLRRRYATVHCPAISTVHAVLDRHGLVTRKGEATGPRRRDAARLAGHPPCLMVCRLQRRIHARQSRVLLSADDHRLCQPLFD